MTVKYEVKEVAGEGLSLNTAKIGKTIQFAVFNGDRKVWNDGTYFSDSLQGRARSAAKGRATKACNRFQSYFERTGLCWEVEQDAKEGEKLFGDEVKALVDATERKLAATVFAKLRIGALDEDDKREIADAATKIIIGLIESRCSDGYISRYRRIRAYADAATRSLSAEAINYFIL
jgi:hypothetical protein